MSPEYGEITLALSIGKGDAANNCRIDQQIYKFLFFTRSVICRKSLCNRQKNPRTMPGIGQTLFVQFGQTQPGLHHGVRVEGQAVDTLFHQPGGKVFVIRWSLSADTHVFTLLLRRAN